MKVIMSLLIMFVAVSGISCQYKARLETLDKEYSKKSYDLTTALLLGTQEIAVMINNPAEASSHIRNIKPLRERIKVDSAFLEGNIPSKRQDDAASMKEIIDCYFLLLDDTEAGFDAICLGNENSATYYFNRAIARVDTLNLLLSLYLGE